MDDSSTLLVRSQDGRVVHVRGCTYAGNNVVGWMWAEGKNRAQVKAAEVMGVSWCKFCDPLGAISK